MTIGLANALMDYRYGAQWDTFFGRLGVQVVRSGATRPGLLSEGIRLADGECCLPLKVFLGHVASLIGRCDAILVPRFIGLGKNEDFCVRFLGLPDIVRQTFPGTPVLTYNLRGFRPMNEQLNFLAMARALGKRPAQALNAYRAAVSAQEAADEIARNNQRRALEQNGLKILVAAQPYILHDECLAGPMLRMIRAHGAIPIYSDRCDRAACRELAGTLSKDLYWVVNKEAIGAIPLLRGRIDGVILVTAFPCGTDSLVNELVLRRIDLPAAHIVLDEQLSETGLETRVESFVEILKERKCASYAG